MQCRRTCTCIWAFADHFTGCAYMHSWRSHITHINYKYNMFGFTGINIGCVLSTWVLSSIGFSFAQTSLCRRDGLFLYPITGGSGKIWLNVLLFFWLISSVF